MTCGSVETDGGVGSSTQISKGGTVPGKAEGGGREAKAKGSSLGIFRNHLGTPQTISGKGNGDCGWFTWVCQGQKSPS